MIHGLLDGGVVSPCTKDIDPPVTNNVMGNSAPVNLSTAPASLRPEVNFLSTPAGNPPLPPEVHLPSTPASNPPLLPITSSENGDTVSLASEVMVCGYENDYQQSPSPPPYSPLTPVMK